MSSDKISAEPGDVGLAPQKQRISLRVGLINHVFSSRIASNLKSPAWQVRGNGRVTGNQTSPRPSPYLGDSAGQITGVYVTLCSLHTFSYNRSEELTRPLSQPLKHS